jgi:hypothetical protein
LADPKSHNLIQSSWAVSTPQNDISQFWVTIPKNFEMTSQKVIESLSPWLQSVRMPFHQEVLRLDVSMTNPEISHQLLGNIHFA